MVATVHNIGTIVSNMDVSGTSSKVEDSGEDAVIYDYDELLEKGDEVVLDPAMAARFDPTIVAAMRGYKALRVFFSAPQAAGSLWDYGEDDLAERVLKLSEEELGLIHGIAATFRNPAYALPMGSQRVTVNHVTAFAALAFLDGELRPLARTRRRPQRLRPDFSSRSR
ncbi:hypothetical protein [Microbacterium lemovicicum]|uniref:hypothetical protein n=1 Tax=Microbacterium lemovicicum TaxID=1072463 RepID=UPI000F8F0E6C|nr:hypothetical protein [Microbacterium lemovicicum]